jgi:hypothetical protein
VNTTPSAITRLQEAAGNNETLTLNALESREIIAEIERLRRAYAIQQGALDCAHERLEQLSEPGGQGICPV